MAKCGEESHSFSYDVFISFRGEDTRHKFIGHLRKELCRKGINTFIDDKNLRIGEGISPALSKAIEESKISIVVFSENYASSKWCLDELVKILDCTKRSGNKKQVAFPIFYHVDPSHVRHQKESYHKAMIAHEDRFGKSSEKVCRWRSALFEIANLKGQHISTGYEIDYIEEIVEQVYTNIAPKPLGVGQNPVGLEHRIEEVKSLLDMEPTDDTVCMLGIYGLGGIGKTELAKALYNKIVHQFEAASFLANVREKSNKINGMEDLQKTLLSEMLEELETELGSPSKGIYEIKRKLGKKKVLLVLDDVDDREQLKNLAGGCDWFGLGSRIIITTRDRKLLLGHQVEKIYEMTELDYQHSLELFCQNAFGKSHPETGYEDMSSLAVGYAKGLPLALKVIGSNLATERSLEDWELLLKKYERIPDSKIQHVLKISYNSLGDDDAKSIFLDIACFFKGERIEYVEKILEEFDATSNIKVLVNKSLLNVEHGCLEMHDLIQDMGREIVRQESRIPSKRSRLWSHKDVLKVLTEDPGSEAIEGIILDPPQREEVEWSGTAFEEMKWLRILIVRNTTFSTWPKYLPNHLRLLDWEEYPSESFPSKFHPKEIVVFNLCKSRLTLEEPFKKFSCLINMDLSHNEFITTMPDVSAVQNLRELRLDKCKNLIEVHESVGFLKKLAHLSASGCIKLKSFLHRMFLPSLEVLDLNLCARLEHFPNVVAFKMGGCSQLRESFRRFAQSPSAANGCPAKTLNFGNGGLSDEDLQTILNCFPKLEELIASENNFVSLPACIKESIHLTSLDVSVCKKLQEIPECTNLRILNVHRCMKLKYISELPSTIQKVDARYCFSLTALSKAIEESKISIVVLSENYASSKWCLNELVHILDCAKRSGNKKQKQIVFPVFYHVDPSDVRHQRSSYGEAMAQHEKKFGENSEKVRRWRLALSQVANLKGEQINTGYENDFIEKIIKQLSADIAPKTIDVGPNPIGLEHHIEKLKSLLDIKPNDDSVCMLGIYGLGGIGKTKLAKVLYNKIVNQFEAASFLANVREKSSKSNGLEELQKTLLSEMLEELETKLGSTSRGIYEIKCKLGKKKVLLVLDDVDDREQLNSLAGSCYWFGLGSRIIITTRNKDLLIGHQVEKIYKMTKLNDQHSLELFCQHTFRKSYPEIGYEDMSSRAIGYAKGLPLAIEVIASNLTVEKCPKYWEYALEKYERIPDQKIQDVLKISYDGLQKDAKSVFLDIACFFKGERTEYVEKILEESNATFNIKLLVNKSLLTIEHGCLEMHDLIQDMGREIINHEAEIPSERSRLWVHDDVINILTEDSGSEKIIGIMLDPPQREEVDWNGTAFEKMKWLRILIVRNTSFTTGPKHLPNQLRVLDWEEYPSNSFPPKFHPKKIIVFNLCKSYIRLEEPFKKFSCLTNMNFSHNQSIATIPDVSEVPNLTKLRLDNCRNLTVVHESVGFLKNLAHFSASGCHKLRIFLQRMFLPSLEVLDLNLCIRLEHFLDIMNIMNKPLKIYMINTAIKEIPDSISNLTGLVWMEIPSSMKLIYLPSSLFLLPNIVAIKISGCSQLQESFRRFVHGPLAANGHPTLKTLFYGKGGLSDEDLHAILNLFPRLEELIVPENNFVSILACIKESVHLTSLDVNACKKLEEIPECTNVRILNIHGCVNLKDISELSSTTRKVDARYCFSLAKETSHMLWYQVFKEIHGLEVVMPTLTEIPDWFSFRGIGGNPHFWARGKFPIVAIALVFQGVKEITNNKSRRQLVELQLFINGQCVPRKGYYNFKLEKHHVLICDLRLLFNEEEWISLDTFLEHDWNLVQVSCQSPLSMKLSSWGVHVYKQGTNEEDVQFICPDPKYSKTTNISLTTVPSRDPKQEQRKMIERLRLDELFDATLMEALDDNPFNYSEEELVVQREQLKDLAATLQNISRQAKDVLEGKEVDDVDNVLPWLVKNMDVGEASTSSHSEEQSKDRQQQELSEMFCQGVWDGLVEAQSNFPTLNIDTIMSIALNKGYKFRWLLPEGEDLLLLHQKDKEYVEGIINGLQEAKLSFPTLDIKATIDAVMQQKYGKKPPMDVGEASTSSHQHESSKEQSIDPKQQQMMMEMFWDGVADGLHEAKNNFPSLHIQKTLTSIFNKGNRVKWLLPKSPLPQPQVEKNIYIEGIAIGLLEAKLSFPTLDIDATLDIVLSKGSHKFPSSIDEKGKQPMDVQEPSSSRLDESSEEQNIDPQELEIMRENLCRGMLDGLLEAQTSFPTLDIETTMIEAVKKGSRFKWLILDSEIEIPEGEGEDPLAHLKRKMYIEGVVNGLIEAKLSFPTLDIQATLTTVLSRGARKGPVEASSTIQEAEDSPTVIASSSNVNPLLRAFIMMNQESCEVEARSKLYWKLIEEHKALRKKFEEFENEIDAPDKDNSLLTWKNRYEELLEKLNTQSALSSSKMHTNITEYEKLAAVLKGRADELQRLYDDGIEGFQNSEEFQDLMSVIYLYGLRDGLLEAQVIILALYMDIKTSVSKENEEQVIGEAAKEVFDWTRVKIECLDDPLLQVFMMMKQGTCKSEAKSKIYWKLMEEHKALRKRFEEVTIALDKDSHLLPSWKNQYDELVEKLNTQSTLSGIEMHTNIPKYEKLAAILKGRTEELRRLYDDGIEGFQNSEEFQDLMNAIYLNGLQDGLLEAQAILLALDLDMDKITPVVSMENEEEEQATDEVVDNENLDGLVGVADIPSPSGHEVDNPNDTSNPSGSGVLSIFWNFFTYIILSCSRN